MHGHQSHSRRRKRRPLHGVKSVDVTRGKTGYGFTISGQHPCVLSCIVSGSPAERAGLKPGDYLVSVNGENVSKAPHDNVVRMIGTSTGTLTLQVAENYNSSDSSDDDYHVRPKSRYPNRTRPRHVIGMSPEPKVLKEQSLNARVSQYNPESRARVTHKNNLPYRRPPSSVSSQSSHGRPQSPLERLVHVDTKWGRLSSCSASRLPEGHKPGTSRSQVNAKSYSASNLKTSADKGISSNIRPGVYPGRSAKPTTRVRSQPDFSACNYTLSQSFYSTPSLGNRADSSAPELAPILHREAFDHSSSLSSSSRYEADQAVGEDEELAAHDPSIRAVVGYVGTIEMPEQDNRLQHIRNAVRRLRVEQKIHTLVLMDVLEYSVRLTNTVGSTVAEYPAEKIVFSGVCPDDKRFFGLVTSHNPEDQTSSSSCHVFMVDPEFQPHNIHAQKAAAFSISCSVDPDTQNCREFPRTASPLVSAVSRLYRDRRGRVDDDVIRSQIFAEPVVVPERHHSSSSNSHDSDSGLGFSKEDNQLNERVYIVDVSASFDRNDVRNSSHHDSFSGSAPDLHHLSPDVSTMPTAHHRHFQHSASSRHSARRLLNISSTSEESLHRSITGKLNIRAMPDPPSMTKYHSNNALDLRHSAESMRRSMHKFLQARQSYIRDVPGTSSDQESQISFSYRPDNIARSCSHSSIERPASAPFKQLTRGLTVQQTKPSVEDLSDKLSPRAFLPFGPTVCSPAPPVRSPSAPPLTTSIDSDTDEEFDTDTLEKKISRFDKDQIERFKGIDGPRRFSEGYALAKKREKEKSVQAEIQRWTKTGSLRRPKHAKKTLSQSHESLIVTDGDLSNQQKLLSANSVNSISGHVNKKSVSQEAEVGRVAGWAVNFEKLLCDAGGLAVFTEFLKKEFSEENIIFWKICLDYKQIDDPTERKLKAKEIYEKHVSSKALEPVNIDSQARQRCEEHLDLPSPAMFDVAQQQIFQLMKQDSYSRFLRSDLYKSCLMSEIEGKPLDFLEEDDIVGDLPSKDDKKLKKNGEPEVKRRKSLLPWVKNKGAKQNAKIKKNKENKEKEENNNNNSQKKSNFATVDLSLMSKEVAQTVEHIPSSDGKDDDEDLQAGNYKFCRIILPDGSSTVVCAKPGQSTHCVLSKLCEKRNFSVASVDVFLQGLDKPLDLNNDISNLGSKDIILEKRVLFRMDLPNHKFIGVKAKPNRSIRDVFKPILHKYGYKVDNVNIQLSDHTGPVDIECPTSSLDNKRVLIIPKDDVIDWSASDGRRLTNGRPPVPPRTKLSQSGQSGLDELTNKVFEDLMQGKSEMAHNFDELGILDPDRPVLKSNRNADDHRLSGLFGLLRRESLGAKDPAKPKVKNKVTFALQKSENRKRGKDHDEDSFLDLLSKMQSQRIEDQRGIGRESFELPDFLQKPSHRGASRGATGQGETTCEKDPVSPDNPLSIQAVEGYDLDDFDDVEPNLLSFQQSDESQTMKTHGRTKSASSADAGVDCRTIRSFKTFGSPTEKVKFTNNSFSQESVVPSYDQALQYFNTINHPANPDFDDPMLMVRSLSDIGLQDNLGAVHSHRSAFKPPLLRVLPPEGFGMDFRAPKASPEKFSSSSTDPELSSPNDSNTSGGQVEFQDYTVHQNNMWESGVTVLQRRPFQSILEQSRVNSALSNPQKHHHSGSKINEKLGGYFENHLSQCLAENQKLLPTEKHQSTKLANKKRLVRVNGASNIVQSQDLPFHETEIGTPNELNAELQHHRGRTRKPVYLHMPEQNPKPPDHQVTFV